MDYPALSFLVGHSKLLFEINNYGCSGEDDCEVKFSLVESVRRLVQSFMMKSVLLGLLEDVEDAVVVKIDLWKQWLGTEFKL